jgi:electron transport complex protein RnfB
VAVAVLVMALLGLLFGGLLAYASRRFAVRRAPEIERVRAALPGADCAACGFAGCDDLAAAIVAGRAPPDACPVGGAAAAARVAAALGLAPPAAAEPRVAAVICRGDARNRRPRYDYEGLADCRAALLTPGGAGGFLLCERGCLGLGTCARVCPVDALHMRPDGLPAVDESRCTGCGRCAAACPRGVLQLVPRGAAAVLRCRSEASARQVRAACRAGCFACHLCEKACPAGAISVSGGLARIDVQKCTSCGICAQKCPVGAIAVRRQGAGEGGGAGGGCGAGGGPGAGTSACGVRSPARRRVPPRRALSRRLLVGAAAAALVVVPLATLAMRGALGQGAPGPAVVPPVPPPCYEIVTIAMDTVLRVAVWGVRAEAAATPGGARGADATARAAAAAAIAEVRRLEGVLSFYDPRSELGLVNAALASAAPEAALDAAPDGVPPAQSPARLAVSRDLAGALQCALGVAAATGGAFDPTVGLLVRAWGFGTADGPHLPDPAALDAARAAVGFQALRLSAGSTGGTGGTGSTGSTGDSGAAVLEAARRPLCLDLGGAAKGYAVDAAARVLRRAGVTSGLVAAGGCVKTVGRPPGGGRWRVAVEDPRRPGATVGVVEVGPGLAVDTAGDYQRFFVSGGVHYHHILDPRTGWPARRSASVTVVAPSAATADALATGMFVLGPERALALADRLGRAVADRLGRAAVVAVDPSGRVLVSGGLRGRQVQGGRPAGGGIDAAWTAGGG